MIDTPTLVDYPGCRTACAVRRGDYAQLPEAWGAFREWIEVEGLETGDHFWEVYAVGPETSENPDDWRTEPYVPLAE